MRIRCVSCRCEGVGEASLLGISVCVWGGGRGGELRCKLCLCGWVGGRVWGYVLRPEHEQHAHQHCVHVSQGCALIRSTADPLCSARKDPGTKLRLHLFTSMCNLDIIQLLAGCFVPWHFFFFFWLLTSMICGRFFLYGEILQSKSMLTEVNYDVLFYYQLCLSDVIPKWWWKFPHFRTLLSFINKSWNKIVDHVSLRSLIHYVIDLFTDECFKIASVPLHFFFLSI